LNGINIPLSSFNASLFAFIQRSYPLLEYFHGSEYFPQTVQRRMETVFFSTDLKRKKKKALPEGPVPLNEIPREWHGNG
jgi:hypothetical protein